MMDVTPIDQLYQLDPAYFLPSPPTIECVITESRRYQVPLVITLALMKTEGGQPGDYIKTKNGKADMGVMQVNTVWLTEYSARTGLPAEVIKVLAVNNGCFSVSLGLDILKKHHQKHGNWQDAVRYYHSGTEHLADIYQARFEKAFFDIQRGQWPSVLKR